MRACILTSHTNFIIRVLSSKDDQQNLLFFTHIIIHHTQYHHPFQSRPRPILLKILPIMLLSSAQKIAHYANAKQKHLRCKKVRGQEEAAL